MSLAEKMLDMIREKHPGKVLLNVEDVAAVLNRSGAGGYQQTRDELTRGKLVKGLRKHGDRWLVPAPALAAALADLVDGEGRPAQQTPASITRTKIVRVADKPAGRSPGRRLAAVRKAQSFWAQVLSIHDKMKLKGIVGTSSGYIPPQPP